MIELRCPTCARANAVRSWTDRDAVRCAECAGELDENLHVRYQVDVGGQIRGPRIYRDLVKGVALGQLRADMLISEEGGPWLRARERGDLFRERRRAPAARAEVARIPSPVLWIANLAAVMGGLLLLLGVLVAIVIPDLGSRSAAVGPVATFLLLGLLHLWLSTALRRGSKAARAVQLGLAGLAGIWVASWLAEGGAAPFVMVGLFFVSVPFFLLLNESARAYFR